MTIENYRALRYNAGMQGMLLQPVAEECPYRDGTFSINESIMVKNLDDSDLEELLAMGFRHFGDIFFRPVCPHCNHCISIRVPVQDFTPSASVKRQLNRTKHLRFNLAPPLPSPEGFQLYTLHKKRFKQKYPIKEPYDIYVKSFFHPFSFNRMFTIHDGDRLVAISHLDVTSTVMSAVYCYYDAAYNRFSPGKTAIYKEILLARDMGLTWFYLGYYIPGNRHTEYKIQYKPNQLMTTPGEWKDHMDHKGIVKGS